VSSSSSNKEVNESSSDNESTKAKRGKGKMKHESKPSYNITSFNYDSLPSSHTLISVHSRKAPHFDGMNYSKWHHGMKVHLMLLNPSIWKVVCINVDLPEEGETPDYNKLQQIHYNAQASNVLLSSLEKDEYDSVDGLEKASEICKTLRLFHERSRPVRKAKIEMLEGQLDWFVMLDNETPQMLYNHMKLMVNKVRAHGSKKWTKKLMVQRLLRAYTIRDTTLVSIIRNDPNLKRMKPDDILARIINYKRHYKKEKKFTKKKSYGQAHVGQEWNSSDESSELESDDLATIDIKDESLSSKSFFPNLSKLTCLIAKEGKKKVKPNAPSSPKYVTNYEDTLSSDDNNASSDDDEPLPSEFCKNPNAMIKGLMKQVRVRDELLEKQVDLLVQERKSNEELKKLLALEKGKVKKLDQELAQTKEATCSLKSSIGALQDQYNVLQKTHKYLEVQFNALWLSTSKLSSDPEAPKASTSRGYERCYNLDINAFCDQSQPSKVEQVLVETCDEAIGKENDDLKREVKRLELEAKKLKKQTKVQSPQDNCSNTMKKFEKGRTASKIVSQ
jgi:hypothetical protein